MIILCIGSTLGSWPYAAARGSSISGLVGCSGRGRRSSLEVKAPTASILALGSICPRRAPCSTACRWVWRAEGILAWIWLRTQAFVQLRTHYLLTGWPQSGTFPSLQYSRSFISWVSYSSLGKNWQSEVVSHSPPG